MCKKIIKFLFFFIIWFVIGSIFITIAYKFINPPVTPLMLIRVIENTIDGKDAKIEKNWASFDNISPNLFRAVIASEDGRFNSHDGIDWKAIEQARKYNERYKGKKRRGASTISMQTARNTFLWLKGGYFRKGLEVFFTYMIEIIWGKRRIIEVYVNVIEWGDGIYGIDAASRKYFNKPPSKLTRREAALLAAVLPNPRRWSPARPTNYIMKRKNTILARMRSVGLPKD